MVTTDTRQVKTLELVSFFLGLDATSRAILAHLKVGEITTVDALERVVAPCVRDFDLYSFSLRLENLMAYKLVERANDPRPMVVSCTLTLYGKQVWDYISQFPEEYRTRSRWESLEIMILLYFGALVLPVLLVVLLGVSQLVLVISGLIMFLSLGGLFWNYRKERYRKIKAFIFFYLLLRAKTNSKDISFEDLLRVLKNTKLVKWVIRNEFLDAITELEQDYLILGFGSRRRIQRRYQLHGLVAGEA